MSDTLFQLSSDKITVYPSARRADTRSDARSLREKNYVNIINKLIDSDGFIISQFDPSDNKNTGKAIEFNIFGYYFKISGGADTILYEQPDNWKYLYAKIELDTLLERQENLYDGGYTELKGYDNQLDGMYTGLTFVYSDSDLSSNDNIKYLKVFEKNGDSFKFSSNSYIKFSSFSVENRDVDGGEIL